MNWIAGIKVSTKLIAGFLIVSTIGGIVSIQGILKASQMKDMANAMYEQETVSLRHAAEASIQLLSAARSVRNAALAFNDDDRRDQMDEMALQLKNIRAQLDAAEPGFTTADDKALIEQARNALEAYEESITETISLLRYEALSQSRESTIHLFGQARPLADQAEALLSQLVQRKTANAEALNQETGQVFSNIKIVLTALTGASVIIGILIGALLSRSLTRQLGGEPDEAVRIAGFIARGDLTVEIKTRPQDRSSLMFAMKRMRESLANVVNEVRGGTLTIRSASSRIAAGNLELSARTEAQAASLEETAASMEELTSTVKQNADNAQQANQLARSASDIAVKGGAVVSQVVGTMRTIEASSQKIANIINVIDSIAFQTNILALNAAVESARAGEQGRGFAVVASEVRSLAQRSAGAAKEIKALIENSVQTTGNGTRLVDAAGITMNEIVESVKQVTDIMGEIAAASQEQTNGIEQVNRAIIQIDQATQQNAAQVVEVTSASAAMQEQADKLAQTVSLFTLEESQPTQTATITSPRPHATAAMVPTYKLLSR